MKRSELALNAATSRSSHFSRSAESPSSLCAYSASRLRFEIRVAHAGLQSQRGDIHSVLLFHGQGEILFQEVQRQRLIHPLVIALVDRLEPRTDVRPVACLKARLAREV